MRLADGATIRQHGDQTNGFTNFAARPHQNFGDGSFIQERVGGEWPTSNTGRGAGRMLAPRHFCDAIAAAPIR
jgi:hypothetical protein